MADTTSRRVAVLKEKIDELESIIEDRSRRREAGIPANERQPQIPILDELVSPEEPAGPEDERQISFELEDPRLEVMADQIEQKLSTELDEIVNILKVNLKQSIRDELNVLHDQLKSGPQKKDNG